MLSFREILESGHNRRNTDLILAAINEDPSRMDELLELFFSKEKMICQRASWPIGNLGEKHPELLIPHFPALFKALENPLHDSVVRNIVRTWKEMDIPEEYEGEVFEKCFDYILSPKNAIAIRAFSVHTCTNIAHKYPELAEELIPVLEEVGPQGSSGFKNCCKNSLILLHKLKAKIGG